VQAVFHLARVESVVSNLDSNCNSISNTTSNQSPIRTLSGLPEHSFFVPSSAPSDKLQHKVQVGAIEFEGALVPLDLNQLADFFFCGTTIGQDIDQKFQVFR